MNNLSDNFTRKELACKGRNCCGGTCSVMSELVDVLQFIRWEFGLPLYVNRAFSCNVHNKYVGGTPDSWHPKGGGADCRWLDDVSNEKVIAHILKLYQVGGLGLYDTHFHVDVRPRIDGKVTIWDKRSIN